ncbi:alkaline phosphatase [Haloplanus aerogenes]|uniref:Alkaline phosphatase n=1 Tax=Haloplanus aerogenes TaxID=660522 RepID=A0A3M0DU08_9EURY|nr:alkaline phosphatase [Haloplanus aerogenes]AZH25666.1 alkaline phosphatase [Haloplanus aerogenes]RMB25395.1 hypothetical protein ATH50_0484 [Haloplanus aerogenes]
MTLTSEWPKSLVEADDPVDVVWDALWDIWWPPSEGPSDHYDHDREWASVELERTLVDIYWEFYSEVLPWRCVNEASIEIPDDGAFLVMDAMSVREASLFAAALESDGYDVKVSYSYATVPSETTPYKKRVGYADMDREYPSATVRDLDPSLSGDERLVWSRYPDALLENIQEGKTELSSVEDAYDDSLRVFRSILDQLDTDRIIVGADHGYVREESGYSFAISEHEKNRLRDTFGGQRFVGVDQADADDLVEDRLAVEADGYYMPVGRYTWPVRGKYSVYQHGGLSLMECLTPRLEVQR